MTTSTTVHHTDAADLMDLVCDLAAIAHRLRRLSAPTDDTGRDDAHRDARQDAHREARRDLDAAARLVDSALDRLHSPIQR
ncbi:hypothetical protein [Nocardioides marmoraquaticus]